MWKFGPMKKTASVPVEPAAVTQLPPALNKQDILTKKDSGVCNVTETETEQTDSKPESFERLIRAPPGKVYETFGSYIWRKNAGVQSVEIVKDSSVGGELEPGMIRRLADGMEEELVIVEKNVMVEFRAIEGGIHYNKTRVVFTPAEENNATRVTWTIWCSQSCYIPGLAYSIIMKGFCELALSRLDQAATTGIERIDPPASHAEEADTYHDDESAGTRQLQWAAQLQTGYEGNLTPQQELALAELRELLVKTDPEAWHLCETHPDGPTRIMLRFLRAECTGKDRRFQVEKSKTRLAETLRFRRDIKVNEMLITDPPHFKEFLKVGAEFDLIDHEGRPVIFTRVGLLSTCLDTHMMSEEEWKTNIVCLTERRMQVMRESSKRLGHEVSASVVVYDVRGAGWASRKMMPFAKMISEVASKHYPEIVDAIIVAFAPAVFAAIFSSVKLFLDPVTASKIQVFGTGKHDMEKMKSKLRGLIDPEVLPVEFGGESLANQVGYPCQQGDTFAPS